MRCIIEKPIIISRGTAVIQISDRDETPGDVCMSPDFVLTIIEIAGRSGTVAFWGSNQTGEGVSPRDHFCGLTWSMVGTGLMVLKTGEVTRPDGNWLYGVAALWPVVEESADIFARAAEKNAVASVELEVGCHAFGIFRSIRDHTVFALIEVFDGAASFSQHLETEHFREFAEYARPQYVGDRSQTLKGDARWK